jgi:hypothetical protein
MSKQPHLLCPSEYIRIPQFIILFYKINNVLNSINPPEIPFPSRLKAEASFSKIDYRANLILEVGRRGREF